MNRYRSAAWALGPALLLSLLLSGCGSGPSMTHAQAVNRVSGLLSGAVAVLSPKPGLELVKYQSGDTDCQSSLGGSSEVTVAKTYQFQGISASEHVTIGQQVLAFWKQQGYTVTQSQGVGTERPDIDAQTGDGIHVSVYSGGDGVLTISAVSQCVSP